jgi:hypothetical protein
MEDVDCAEVGVRTVDEGCEPGGRVDEDAEAGGFCVEEVDEFAQLDV